MTTLKKVYLAMITVLQTQSLHLLVKSKLFFDEDLSSWERTQHNRSASRIGCVNNAFFDRRDLKLTEHSISYDTSIPSIRDRIEMSDSGGWCERMTQPFRQYRPADVVRCFDSLSAKRNRRPMHIAFIGDSTIRQHFSLFLQLFPDYDRKIMRLSNLWIPFFEEHHEDRNVTSQLLDNLKISFYWRNTIKDDLIADFKRWATTNDDSKAPDFIILGVTAHHIDTRKNDKNIIDSFRIYENLLMKLLVPLLNQSMDAHPHQEIIWLRQSATNMNQFHRGFYSIAIQMFNDAVHRSLKNTRVVVWDGINAIVDEYLRACALSRNGRQGDAVKVDGRYFNCNDFIHPGLVAVSIGTQFLINHMCD